MYNKQYDLDNMLRPDDHFEEERSRAVGAFVHNWAPPTALAEGIAKTIAKYEEHR